MSALLMTCYWTYISTLVIAMSSLSLSSSRHTLITTSAVVETDKSLKKGVVIPQVLVFQRRVGQKLPGPQAVPAHVQSLPIKSCLLPLHLQLPATNDQTCLPLLLMLIPSR